MEARVRVVLASGNAGKAREFERLLAPVRVDPLPYDILLPEETGRTFAENAELKARAVFAQLNGTVAVLADDSGLEVRALGGRPGVLSARYAGDTASDHENVALLLRELEGAVDRSARFVCELVLLVPGPAVVGGNEPLVVRARGTAEGTVETAPRGTEGFGYDPVFRPLGWVRTLAEVDPATKDLVSHRAAAARVLVDHMRALGLLGGSVDER